MGSPDADNSSSIAEVGKDSSNTADVLWRKILRRSSYEKLPPPGGPTIVELGIYINYFYDISEQTMDYRLSFYLRQQWFDSRLRFSIAENGNKEKLILGVSATESMWIPSVFFANEKGASFHKVMRLNRLTYLHNDGRIWFVTKVSTTMSCPMRLQKYPLDTQECPMLFHSFGYPSDTVQYKWLPNPYAIQFDDTAYQLTEMKLVNHTTRDCSFNDTKANPPGIYPCLEVKFKVQRNLGYFMIQFYFPSVLLVTMSWVSFWISSDAVVARVSIGLLTVLNLVTQSTGSQKQLPKVSYVKAIDVWMTTCLVFAFASLIEFATVNVWSRTEARQVKSVVPPPPPSTSVSTAGKISEDIPLEQRTSRRSVSPQTRWKRGPFNSRKRLDGGLLGVGSSSTVVAAPTGLSLHQQRAKTLDRLSRKVFPSAFLVFNIVYWLAYGL